MKKRGCHLFGFLFLFLVAVTPAQAQRGYGRAVAVGDGEVLVAEPANQMSSGVVSYTVAMAPATGLNPPSSWRLMLPRVTGSVRLSP